MATTKEIHGRHLDGHADTQYKPGRSHPGEEGYKYLTGVNEDHGRDSVQDHHRSVKPTVEHVHPWDHKTIEYMHDHHVGSRQDSSHVIDKYGNRFKQQKEKITLQEAEARGYHKYKTSQASIQEKETLSTQVEEEKSLPKGPVEDEVENRSHVEAKDNIPEENYAPTDSFTRYAPIPTFMSSFGPRHLLERSHREYKDPFEAMAPLHRPEFDALVDVVKTLREDLRREHKDFKPTLELLEAKVEQYARGQIEVQKKTTSHISVSGEKIERIQNTLANAVDTTLDELENLKEDLDINANNISELMSWRASANKESVEVSSRVDRLELQFGLQKQMVGNLRNDYAEDHASVLRLQRSINHLEFNQDNLANEMKKCVAKSMEIKKNLEGAFAEVKSYCDGTITEHEVSARRRTNERLQTETSRFNSEIEMISQKVSDLMAQQKANEGAISSIVGATSIFQDNLGSIISEYNVLKRRSAESMSRMDNLESSQTDQRRHIKNLEGSVLAARESSIRSIEASCSSLEARMRDAVKQEIVARLDPVKY